jgi:hypothetical protein
MFDLPKKKGKIILINFKRFLNHVRQLLILITDFK